MAIGKLLLVGVALVAWVHFLLCVGDLVRHHLKEYRRGGTDPKVCRRGAREGRRRARRTGTAMLGLLLALAAVWWALTVGAVAAGPLEVDVSPAGGVLTPMTYLNTLQAMQQHPFAPGSGAVPVMVLSPPGGGAAVSPGSSPYTSIMYLVPSPAMASSSVSSGGSLASIPPPPGGALPVPGVAAASPSTFSMSIPSVSSTRPTSSSPAPGAPAAPLDVSFSEAPYGARSAAPVAAGAK